jgi:histidine kinase
VWVNPQDIGRVFLNLLDNARYAVAARRRAEGEGFTPLIRITTRALGDRIEVRVWDNGAGIAAAIREQIFTPFFTTRPSGEGAGLGLSISHEIVVQGNGGTLKVESEEGAFTEFAFTLPVGRNSLALS